MEAKKGRGRLLCGQGNERLASHAPRPGLERAGGTCRIYIVGPRLLLNGLMANILDRAFGIGCTCCGLADFTPAMVRGNHEGPSLVLLDGHPRELRGAPLNLAGQFNSRRFAAYICLHNVRANNAGDLELEAFQAGIRGIFYQDDPLETLVKGIQAVLAGERWYSRETLTRCQLARIGAQRRSNGGGDALGFRERQILRLIATGLTNVEIARQLNLSIHTIKTHAYNLYRKIDAPNRVQATLWAAKHMAN